MTFPTSIQAEACIFPTNPSHLKTDVKEIRLVNVPLEKPDSLVSMCSSEHLSKSTVTKVAWAVVLRCFLGSDNVCFGLMSEMPVSSDFERHLAAKSVVGRCSITFTETDTVLDVLERVEAETWEEKHTKWASKPGSFNTAVQVTNGRPGHEGRPLTVFEDAIAIRIFESMTGYQLIYQTKSITGTVAINVAHTFAAVIFEISERPMQSIASLRVLSDRDMRQILQWNPTSPEFLRRDTCIHHLIKTQVDAHPHWLAVDAWDGRLSFQELWNKSSRLAYLLVQLGVGPEAMVPLCFETSRWGIVAMLAVLRAGGVCVPLDTSDPTHRIDVIIREIQPAVAIVAPSQRSKLQGKVDTLITDLPELLEKQETCLPESTTRVRPRDAAFLMFTSGSTGVPKGIIQEHASICTSISHLADVLQISCQSRVFQNAAYIFDVSIADIFGTMARGGCVCCAADTQRDNDLAGALTTFRATHACLTPTHLAQLDPVSVPTVRCISVGGESLNRADVEKWASSVRLSHIYGTTESTIWCTLNEEVQPQSDPSNIGRPFGCVAWIVDARDHQKLAPIGATGELLIEGPVLARGYLDSLATSESFISAPAWLTHIRKEERCRLYKTGDLVRYETDGSIKFIGRKDTQVKLQSYRVELAEVEYYLRQTLPAGTQAIACVFDLEEVGTELELVAFIRIPSRETTVQHELDLHSLRKKLARLLPAYMVPSTFILVDELPRTASGKTDRKKLQNWFLKPGYQLGA